ncbi:retrovirus-related Pol polyprotein from transposon 412 [Trichonephila clavipes]|nr:retrovirus-related Pol polyprotein from transposon 412 [Trichonephila clavipes]
MAYLGKARKEDLRQLAEELNLNVGDNMKMADLSKLITTHPDYDEEFSKNLLTIVVEDRKLREQQEVVRKQQEFEKERERLDREFQLEKLRLESKESWHRKRHWVSALLALMPSEINQLMAREAEEKFDDYDYIKDLLLKRFKLSAEIFRQKFVKHQRNPAQSWRDFVFEITSYFEEWLGGLGVNDFEGLKNLMITDQLKRRVPGDVREQFIDDWVKSIVPGDLADKLDEYESVRANVKGAHSNDTRKTKEVVTARVSIPVSVPINTRNGIDDLQLVDIKCGQTSIKAVIDTGAQISVLREDLIDKGCGEGEGTIQIISAFGEKEIAALKLFNLKIDDGKHGSVPIMCAVSKKLVNDMLISATAYEILLENVQLFDFENQRDFEDTKDKDIQLEREEELSALALGQETDTSETNVAKSSFVKLQRMDESLRSVWGQAENKQNAYDIDDGVLVHIESICGENVKQVVLPTCKREEVMRMAHEIPLAGHLGESKTKQRIKYSFFWPKLKQDVKSFCQSCKTCQLRRGLTYRDRIPITPIVRPENPFEVWSVDCIGPLEPSSRRGHKYIICAVDICTRWAEAVPVRNIKAKTTCEVLMRIFTQTGFPRIICTDQGTNFTAELTEAFKDALGIAPRFATPGHPESMGAVERWNRTLKEMLNKNIQENGNNWDSHLPYLMFAYREVPHSTTGVSPYQLVYGRLPNGPLKLLKEVWTGGKEIPTGSSKSIEEYLRDLTEKLKQAHNLARGNSEKAQAEYASRYNLRSREKRLAVGDQVLVLIPSSSHKLLKKWMGPASIVELTRPHTARVKMEDGSERELHFNKLRPYVARIEQIGLIFDQDNEFGDLHYAPTDTVELDVNDIYKHVMDGSAGLENPQKHQLADLLSKFSDVFSSVPGSAKVKGHSVSLMPDFVPKKLKPYRIPIALQEEVNKQINDLLQLGLIEPSESEWAHPIVCVSKRDGSVRLCVDYRLLNNVTITDAYPMQNARDLLLKSAKPDS